MIVGAHLRVAWLVVFIFCAARAATEDLLLRDWIRGLRVDVPQFKISKAVSKLGFDVDIKGGTCSGLTLAEVRLPEAVGDASGVQLRLQTDLGIGCSLQVDIEVLLSSPCTVSLTTHTSAASLGLQVSAGLDGLPGSVSASCKLSPDIEQLDFKGSSLVCHTLRLAEGSIRVFINSFAAASVCREVSALLSSHLSEASNSLRAAALPFLGPAPVLPVPDTSSEALGLRGALWQGPVGHVLRSFLQEVGHTDNVTRFDEVLDFLLRDTGLAAQDGSVALPVAGLELQAEVPILRGALVRLRISSASIENLSSFQELQLGFPDNLVVQGEGALAPAASVASQAALLLPNSTAEVQLGGLVFNITQGLPLATLHITGSTDIQVKGATTVFAALNSTGLRSLQLDQMLTLGCAPEFMVAGYGSPAQVLEARCSLDLQRLEARLPDLGPADLETQLLEVALGSARALGAAFGVRAAQVLDGFVSSTGRGKINAALEHALSQQSLCPASNFSQGEIRAMDVPARWTSGLLLGLTSLLICGAFLCPITWAEDQSSSPRQEQALQQEPQAAARQLPGPLQALEAGLLRSITSARSLISARSGQDGSCRSSTASSASTTPRADLNAASPASPCEGDAQSCSQQNRQGLGWDPQVSPLLRWGMISGIMGTMAMFVVASVTPGVLVSAYFEASDGAYETPDLAQLSMDNSLAQMLSVGSYFVVFAMVLFSVIWPYVKLLVMLYVWIAPVKLAARGPLLVFLDQVGKWSLTDNFILFLFVVFFGIAWTGEDVVDGGAASFKLKCSPSIELNTFLGATILSLVLGHGMLWIHRSQGTDHSAAAGQATRQVGPARFCRTGFSHIVCVFLMVLSWRAEIVVVSFGGLIGTFLKVTGQPTTQRYSILSILMHLGTQGSAYLQVTMAIFVLIIPVLHLVSMTFLCFLPLRPKIRQNLLRLCQTMSAWAAFDVFFIAYLAAVLGGEKYGIAQFVQFIIYKQNVAPLCNGLRELGIECLELELSMLPGAAMVALAVAACYAAGLLAVRAQAVVAERAASSQ